MRTFITACVLIFMGMTLNAQQQKVMDNVQQVQVTDTEDYAIVKDEIVDGVRYVVATPSAKVCSKQIDIEIKDGVIQKVVYTRGEAIKRLDGITCGKRGTSCPDQLAKVLKALK